MRRKDRAVKSWHEIIDILQRADTIRLGINGDPFPYVVPLSFGFEDCAGEIRLYFHGAKEGFKHTLLEQNNHVCIEADILHKYEETEASLTARYESIIGFGTAESVQGEEAARGMDLMCAHCGYPDFAYDPAALDFVRIYRVTLTHVTGKKNIT